MSRRLHILVTNEDGLSVCFSCAKKTFVASLVTTLFILLVLCVAGFSSGGLFLENNEMARKLAIIQERVDKSDQVIAAHQEQVTTLRIDKENQAAAYKQEKETLLSTAVGELKVRCELVERMISKIGVKVDVSRGDKGKSRSGGPFIAKGTRQYDALLRKADAYLDVVDFLPLGRPTGGAVVSAFGNRIDPINGKESFHAGMDFDSPLGHNVYSTAAGVVSRVLWSETYGNYAEIDHRNGYVTRYAHLQKYVLSAGDQVKRGQLVGYVGDTGRSTGPHLHYEVHFQGMPINPAQFIQIAESLHTDGLKRE